MKLQRPSYEIDRKKTKKRKLENSLISLLYSYFQEIK